MGIWDVSVSSVQFCCEPESALKNEAFKNVKIEQQSRLLNLLIRLFRKSEFDLALAQNSCYHLRIDINFLMLVQVTQEEREQSLHPELQYPFTWWPWWGPSAIAETACMIRSSCPGCHGEGAWSSTFLFYLFPSRILGLGNKCQGRL